MKFVAAFAILSSFVGVIAAPIEQSQKRDLLSLPVSLNDIEIEIGDIEVKIGKVVDIASATAVVGSLQGTVADLVADINLLNTVDFATTTVIGGEPCDTVVQKASKLANSILDTVNPLILELEAEFPGLESLVEPIFDQLQVAINIVASLVNTVNALVGGIAKPVTDVVNGLGLTPKIGLIGL